MAKIKVHELAKELGINSKDIIETLTNTEYAVKAAQSNVEEEAQEIVRKKFQKASEPVAEAPKAEPVKEEPKAEVVTEEAKPKKKNITAVFNAQYSKQGGNNRNGNRRPQDGRRPQGDRPARPQGERQPRPNGEKPQNAAPVKPMSGQDMRNYFESLINPNAKKEVAAAQEAEQAKEAEVKTEAPVQPTERVFKKPVENVEGFSF